MIVTHAQAVTSSVFKEYLALQDVDDRDGDDQLVCKSGRLPCASHFCFHYSGADLDPMQAPMLTCLPRWWRRLNLTSRAPHLDRLLALRQGQTHRDLIQHAKTIRIVSLGYPVESGRLSPMSQDIGQNHATTSIINQLTGITACIIEHAVWTPATIIEAMLLPFQSTLRAGSLGPALAKLQHLSILEIFGDFAVNDHWGTLPWATKSLNTLDLSRCYNLTVARLDALLACFCIRLERFVLNRVAPEDGKLNDKVIQNPDALLTSLQIYAFPKLYDLRLDLLDWCPLTLSRFASSISLRRLDKTELRGCGLSPILADWVDPDLQQEDLFDFLYTIMSLNESSFPALEEWNWWLEDTGTPTELRSAAVCMTRG